MASVRVLHSTESWLPITATWLYNQIRFLPNDIANAVSCHEICNAGSFPLPSVYCLKSESRFGWYLERFYTKARLPFPNRFLRSVIHRFQADLIHSHFGPTGIRDSYTASRLGCPQIVTVYGYDVSRLPKVFPKIIDDYKRLFRRVAFVLCEGPFMANTVERLGCRREQIRIQKLGVPTDVIPFLPRSWDGNRPLKILISGTFREKKGIPIAIEAISSLRDDVDIELTLVGGATSEPRSLIEERRIHSAIARSGLSGKVKLLGNLDYQSLIDIAYEHDVFVSPSITAEDGDSEGGAPVTLIEMAATGMQVVSSYHCDIPQVVLHGETGRLAPEGDTTAVTRELRWLIDHPDQWQATAIRAREHIEANFCAKKQANELRNFYHEIAGK